MTVLFWTSIGFVIFYRLISALIAGYSAIKDKQNINILNIYSCCFDAFLGLIDVYIVKVIYGSMKSDAKEPTQKQNTIQLAEAIIEALPQVVLQSVFIIRSQNDPYLSGQNTLYLVGLSLLASLASISNKYLFVDKNCFVDDAKDAEWSQKAPYVNTLYLLRVIWRFSFVTTRFAILSLVWSVLGGAFLLIFLSISFILWCALIYKEMYMYIGARLIVGYALISLVATPAYESYIFAIGHGIEMIVTMCVITLFAFNSSIDCTICADPITRQCTKNSYILSFIITGWVAMIIDFITFYMLLRFNKFRCLSAAMFAAFKTGMQEQIFTNKKKKKKKFKPQRTGLSICGSSRP
eukprot:447786_1